MRKSIKEKLETEIKECKGDLEVMKLLGANIPKASKFKLMNKKTIEILNDGFPFKMVENYYGEEGLRKIYPISFRKSFTYNYQKEYDKFILETKYITFEYKKLRGNHVDWDNFEEFIDERIEYANSKIIEFEAQLLRLDEDIKKFKELRSYVEEQANLHKESALRWNFNALLIE